MEKLFHCVSYYPELWPEQEIERDIAYMKECGINLVRMGEFAWHFMEPRPDEIDVSFFVKTANRLYQEGIYTIMCTPTPTPPIWLTHNHPERLVTDIYGNKYIHGARRHVCTNNPYLRERGLKITEAMAKAFSGSPAVIAWQLDNELKALVGECVCSECRKRWHKWLKDKYGAIENLNQAWGTEIWSEYYNSFEEVVQPLNPPVIHNSSLMTNYRQFSRETVNEFAHEQAAMIRKYSNAPITHDVHTNFALDTHALFEGLDFTSMNGYTQDDGYNIWLFDYDLYRAMKQDGQFFVSETSPSYAGNLLMTTRPHREGFLEIEALGAYASGAFGFSYWLFRQQRSGMEQPHGSLISSWGEPELGFEQVKRVEKMRQTIQPYFLRTRHKQPQAAMTYSEQARLFFFTEPLLEGEGYFEMMLKLHGSLECMGLHRDLIGENASLEGYKLLISPFLPYVSDEYICKASEFVQNGGIWIIGPMTGYRTKEHTVHTDRCLSSLEELAGVRVKYFYPMSNTGAMGRLKEMSAPLVLHGCILEPVEAESVGSIKGGLTPDYSFITEKKLGKGKIVLLGAMPNINLKEGQVLWRGIIEHYADEAGIDDRFKAKEGTTVIFRTGEYEIVTAINGNGEGGEYYLPRDGYEIFSASQVSAGSRRLPPFGYETVILGHKK